MTILKNRLKEEDANKADIHLKIKTLTKAINTKQIEAHHQKKSGDELFFVIFNFDIKNPHIDEAICHDPEELLADYSKQQADIQALRNQLKGILSSALTVKGE